MEIKHPQYLGQKLLERGFRAWFKYMFYVVEDMKFIEEALHDGLFDFFDDIVSGKRKRENLNIPPRSAKTTICIYFIAYSWVLNPKSNFIYTSFSQELLKENARRLMNILEHPIFKAMFPLSATQETEEIAAIDEFWASYLGLEKGSHKMTYSAKKITTPHGGVCLFASIGSAITGFGAGLRTAKKFSGALIIDDANKPSEIHSKTMRNKVITYFDETLLSRLNNSDVPIINVQQRVHKKDLSGVLFEKYKFNGFIKKLVVDGVCQLPKQYTEERIKELKINNYKWQAQYQQIPIDLGGNLIDRSWFQFYKTAPKYYERIIIAADTAQKTGEANDYTVFQAWGLFEGRIYLIDMIRGKWDADDLLSNACAFIDKNKKINTIPLSSVLIEDKTSGTGLIQQLKKRGGYPITPVPRTRDKLTRLIDIVSYIKTGLVFLPFSEDYLSNETILREAEEFSADNSHEHDDTLDPMIDAINDLIAGTFSRKKVKVW